MKAIVLAAGKGVRMRPLTETTPKPLLRVCGTPLLEHITRALPRAIQELVFVVGYKHEQIRDYFGNKFHGRSVTYVEQHENTGTFKALELCQEHLEPQERFLLMYADDLHGSDGLAACVADGQRTILTSVVQDPHEFGVVVTDSRGYVLDIEEKPEHPKSNQVSNGVLVLDTNVLEFRPEPRVTGEYYLAEAIRLMVKAGYRFKAIPSQHWIPIGYPHDLVRAESVMRQNKFFAA